MDVQTIISNVGFPIFCVIVMFKQWNDERVAHKEESDKWVEAIHNNTLVMQQLLAKLENMGDE